jgi:DNA primase
MNSQYAKEVFQALGTFRIELPLWGFANTGYTTLDAAGWAWIVNLGCIELHPYPVRAGDLKHPDELRVDLDRFQESAGLMYVA